MQKEEEKKDKIRKMELRSITLTGILFLVQILSW